MTQVGKAYLVGAGPGDPDLMTVKAARLLRRGDVIVYDRLIQEKVLALARAIAAFQLRQILGIHADRRKSFADHIQRVFRQIQRRQFFSREPPDFGGVAGGDEIAPHPAA